jgi:hypothetical protein
MNASACQRAPKAWRINNFNGQHSRLKDWMRLFSVVASSCLHHCFGWFRALERFLPVALSPSALWALAIGIRLHSQNTRFGGAQQRAPAPVDGATSRGASPGVNRRGTPSHAQRTALSKRSMGK